MHKIVHSTLGMSFGVFLMSVQYAFCADINLNYIARYKDLAIQEQSLTGIPASIKLSMALLESGSGQSYLATKGNNHFGIKWWNFANDGAAFIETFDDDKDRHGKSIVSRFIKFHSVEASYRKHSEVLKRSRYQVLFSYKTTDYHLWAYGLEACGYATAKGYGARLIQLIERYNLTQYDVLSPIAFSDKLGEQLEQLDANFQIAATDSQSDVEPKNEPASGYNPNYSINKKATYAAKPPPQYPHRLEPPKPAAKGIKPLGGSPKPVVESQFVNNQGEVVHYILYEVAEEAQKN